MPNLPTVSRRRHKCDEAATAQAGYADARSYRTLAGQEFLFGADKTARRIELFERDHSRCRFCRRIVTWETGEWHHDPPLSKGGDDSLAGGKLACWRCHRLEDGRYPRWTRHAAAQEAGANG